VQTGTWTLSGRENLFLNRPKNFKILQMLSKKMAPVRKSAKNISIETGKKYIGDKKIFIFSKNVLHLFFRNDPLSKSVQTGFLRDTVKMQTLVSFHHSHLTLLNHNFPGDKSNKTFFFFVTDDEAKRAEANPTKPFTVVI
jgi:hypothetical protein